MRVIKDVELQDLMAGKETAMSVLKPELQAFMDSGAKWAELDTMHYSVSYASQIFMRLTRVIPEFRGKVAVHFKKHTILAERID